MERKVGNPNFGSINQLKAPAITFDKIEGIFFDLDGTLIQHTDFVYDIGLKFIIDITKKYNLTKHNITTADEFRIVRQTHGLSHIFENDTGARLEFWQQLHTHAQQPMIPMLDSFDILETAKGLQKTIGFITARPHRKHLFENLRSSGLYEYCDYFSAHADDSFEAIDKTARLKRASSETWIPAHKILYVGDHAADLISAADAGMHFAAVKTGECDWKEGASYTSDHYSDKIVRPDIIANNLTDLLRQLLNN